MDIGSFLRSLRQKAGMTQQEAAAALNACGIHKTYKAIAAYENGRSVPNADVFLHLCNLYNCGNPLAELAELEGGEISEEQFSSEEVKLINDYRELDYYGRDTVNSVMESELRRVNDADKVQMAQPFGTERLYLEVPYYPMAVGLGSGRMVDAGAPESIVCRIDSVPAGTDFAVTASGDSMRPLYESGDLLFIKSVNSLNGGEIGLFNVNGEQMVKRLGEGVLESINPNYGPIPLKGAAVYVQGKVLGKLEK